MGCDIHFATEKRVNNQWVYLEDELYFEDWDNQRSHPCTDFYRGRDYDLFSFLAGIRGSFTTARTCLGLPDDLSTLAQLKLLSADHSFTYYTAEELLGYMETIFSPEFALVPIEFYNSMIKQGLKRPPYYLEPESSVYLRGDVKIIEYHAYVKGTEIKVDPEPDKFILVECYINVLAKDRFKFFYKQVNKAVTLSKTTADNVRFIMGFDN